MQKKNEHSFKRKHPAIKNYRRVINDIQLPAIPNTLTGKERMFVHEYLYDWNATRAALAAGLAYNPKTAGTVGCEYTKKPSIQLYLQQVEGHV